MAYWNGAKIDFSRPAKPADNAFVESFNGTFRAECLNAHWRMDLKEAKQLIESRRREYNEIRPHASLGDRTPGEFASESGSPRTDCTLKPPKTNISAGAKRLDSSLNREIPAIAG